MISNLPMTNTAGVPSNAWSLGAGADKIVAMNVNDDDTTYITTAADATIQNYNVDWPPVAVVNSIKTLVRSRKTSAGTACSTLHGVRNGSGNTTGTYVLTTSYVNNTTAALARPGGGPWTNADTLAGVTWYHIAASIIDPNNIRATYGHLILDFDPPAGGFAFLIGSLVGAMLGANLLLADMPGIARQVALHPRRGEGISIIQPHEFERALRELREHPFRSYSLPAVA